MMMKQKTSKMACCASFPWALIEKTCFLESITSRRLEIRKTMITTFVWQMIGSSGSASLQTVYYDNIFFVNGPPLANRKVYYDDIFCKWSVSSRWADILQTLWTTTTIYFENDPDHSDVQRGRNKIHYYDCLQIIWITNMSSTFFTCDSTSIHIKN